MEKAIVKVQLQQAEPEKFSTLPAFNASTRVVQPTDHTVFENDARRILKAGSGIGGGNFIKQQRGGGAVTFHGKLKDKEND